MDRHSSNINSMRRMLKSNSNQNYLARKKINSLKNNCLNFLAIFIIFNPLLAVNASSPDWISVPKVNMENSYGIRIVSKKIKMGL